MAEYTHIEGERPFINFEQLLDTIEDLVVDTIERILKHPEAHLLFEVNPVIRIKINESNFVGLIFK